MQSPAFADFHIKNTSLYSLAQTYKQKSCFMLMAVLEKELYKNNNVVVTFVSWCNIYLLYALLSCLCVNDLHLIFNLSYFYRFVFIYEFVVFKLMILMSIYYFLFILHLIIHIFLDSNLLYLSKRKKKYAFSYLDFFFLSFICICVMIIILSVLIEV